MGADNVATMVVSVKRFSQRGSKPLRDLLKNIPSAARKTPSQMLPSIRISSLLDRSSVTGSCSVVSPSWAGSASWSSGVSSETGARMGSSVDIVLETILAVHLWN